MKSGKDISSDRFCDGSGRFADLKEGAEVLILDEAGATVGAGSLGVGELANITKCTWHFSIEGVTDRGGSISLLSSCCHH